MKRYSKLLRLCRQREDLTQKEFVERLSSFSDHFIDISPVTLSRWETGTTTPSLQKKKALLHYIFAHHCLDDVVCKSFMRKAFLTLVQPMSKKLDHKYSGIIGNLEPFKVDAKQYLFTKMNDYPDSKLSYIIDIEKANHPAHYYALTLSKLKEWGEHESSFCLGCELDGEHVGHVMVLKVSAQMATNVIQNQQSIFSLSQDDLLSSSEAGTYLIHTFFGINSEIMAMLSIRTLLLFLEKRDSIDNIAILITRKEGLKLMKLYGHHIVEEGYDNEKNYRWYGTLTPLEEILFSDLIVQMLFS